MTAPQEDATAVRDGEPGSCKSAAVEEGARHQDFKDRTMPVTRVTTEIAWKGYFCGQTPSHNLELVELFGYATALLIGVSLGLLGGGGAIIVVPVLVYLFKKDAETATAYSLFIVSLAALVGFVRSKMKGLVDVTTGLVFAVPAFIATFVVRAYVIPILPDELFSLGNFMVTKDMGIMGLFAVVMVLASVSMIRSNKPPPTPIRPVSAPTPKPSSKTSG